MDDSWGVHSSLDELSSSSSSLCSSSHELVLSVVVCSCTSGCLWLLTLGDGGEEELFLMHMRSSWAMILLMT
jgi:hypothetical protein